MTPDDLDDAVELWRRATAGDAPLFGIADVVAALDAGDPALAAVDEGRLVGTAVVRCEGRRGWLLRWVVDPDLRRSGVGTALMDALLDRVDRLGVERLTAVVPVDERGLEAFDAAGFTRRSEVAWFDRPTAAPGAPGAAELGATVVDPDLWDSLAGMAQAKNLIEQRLILPLQQPVTARELGVEPPRAVVLFGPPGTGKTTFARGVAGRLGWPFVELLPSGLVSAEGGVVAGLRAFFEQVEQLDRVLLFIDEVEEIAGARQGDRVQHAVTNELLKLIPAFRGREGRLLVCATNHVGTLDDAFLRPGRFDYLLPVGPPDEAARRAIWTAYVERSRGGGGVDLEEVVGASEGFTPADIEFTARKAAQRAFERAQKDDQASVTTEDYLLAVREVGPSLDRDALRRFEDDIAEHART
jgi:AAA+ superfamily predicted ATPase/GNAT superfamily N-acetyltransferase